MRVGEPLVEIDEYPLLIQHTINSKIFSGVLFPEVDFLFQMVQAGQSAARPKAAREKIVGVTDQKDIEPPLAYAEPFIVPLLESIAANFR